MLILSSPSFPQKFLIDDGSANAVILTAESLAKLHDRTYQIESISLVVYRERRLWQSVGKLFALVVVVEV